MIKDNLREPATVIEAQQQKKGELYRVSSAISDPYRMGDGGGTVQSQTQILQILILAKIPFG